MDVILFETASTSAAEDIVTAVEAQQLWGVDMGTTSKSSSYSNYAVVEATATRVSNLIAAMPEAVSMEVHIHDVYSFTDASSEEKLWYLRGKL
mgnify:FL=1